MPESYRQSVDRLINHALRVCEALEVHEERNFDREQAVLLNGLLALPESTSGHPDDLGPRYVLACWLDELFIHYSPWASRWNENKLEARLYGVNDRAWEFWRQARVAEGRGDEELLRTLYLCVALGFRGQLRDDPQSLEQWMDRMKVRVSRYDGAARSLDVFDRTPRAPQVLTGDRALRQAVTTAAVVLLASTPVLTYAFLQYLLR